MMKKIMLMLIFSLFSFELTANSQINAIQKDSFLGSKAVRLNDLSFKNIMRTFYAGRLVNGEVYVIDVENYDVTYDSDNDKLIPLPNSTLLTAPLILDKLPKEKYDPKTKKTYPLIQMFSASDYYGAYMSNVIQYKNTKNEDRYMVMVTTEGLEENGTLIGLRYALSIVDIYVFKKNTDNTFTLVTRTKEDVIPDGGDAQIFSRGIDPNIDQQPVEFKALGKNITGAIEERLYSLGQGYYSSSWVILQLPEDDYINWNWILKGEMSAMNEDSPTYYDYDSKINILNDGSKYFPLLVHYKGEKPIYRKDGTISNVKNVNVVTKFIFDPAKTDYVERK